MKIIRSQRRRTILITKEQYETISNLWTWVFSPLIYILGCSNLKSVSMNVKSYIYPTLSQLRYIWPPSKSTHRNQKAQNLILGYQFVVIVLETKDSKILAFSFLELKPLFMETGMPKGAPM